MEMFREYIQALQNENNLTMGINVSYSTWIIKKFMLQILLKSLLCFASTDKEVLITLVEACVSFEDNSLTIDSFTASIGGLA